MDVGSVSISVSACLRGYSLTLLVSSCFLIILKVSKKNEMAGEIYRFVMQVEVLPPS